MRGRARVVEQGGFGLAASAPGCVASGTAVARAAKLVTIVVRDGANVSKILFRESSTLERALG